MAARKGGHCFSLQRKQRVSSLKFLKKLRARRNCFELIFSQKKPSRRNVGAIFNFQPAFTCFQGLFLSSSHHGDF